MYSTNPCMLVLALLLKPAFAWSQEKQKEPSDHGRVVACALDVFPHKLKDTTNLADTKNYVFRGQVISLGKDRKVSICYDTEHLRVAGAWLGKPITFTADKNMGPTVEGEMLFATRPGPGWADPRERRRPQGVSDWDDPRDGKTGPLPRDWADYKGLYLHGDRVIVHYTVGDMGVYETPSVIHEADCTVIVRTFRYGPSRLRHKLQLFETPPKLIGNVYNGKLGDEPVIILETKSANGAASAGVMGLPDAQFTWEAGRAYMTISPTENGGRFIVFQFAKAFSAPRKLDNATLGKLLKTHDIDLGKLRYGGPPRWTETLETTGIRGDDKAGPYAVDQIKLPEKNPWNASIRFAGLDFFSDGRAALCTWDGDVWIVSGLDDSLKKIRWKRFAAGLHAPLGLKIINGIIHVAGRDQITKLHDLNNDGEADFYENFNNDPSLTLQRHEFVMDLQTDKDGNLYYCRSGHYIQSKRGDNCVVYKISPNGKKIEKFASGFREPNGMAIGPDGTMTVADNEGNGIPQTPIYHLKQGANYGFTPSLTGKPDEGTWKLREQPIVWLGPKVDASAGSQVWVPDKKDWGPLAGKLLHTSYGNCALFHLMIDKAGDPWQGAVWKFPLSFESGIMRARFSPTDGQLYVCGLRGWSTSAVKDGQFARVRCTGNQTPIPVAYRVLKTGLEFTFSQILDKAATEDADNWAGTWTEALKKTPTAKELQEMPITSVRLAADRKTVTIALDKLRAVPNFALQYRIEAADGTKISGELNGTIHRVP
jgi:hypothetical protein